MKKLMILISFLLLTLNLQAENMEMRDTDGKNYKVNAVNDDIMIEGMEGKVVILEFFGLKCPGCEQTVPHLIKLQAKHSDKVQVLAIEVQQHDVDPIKAYRQQHGINYTTFSNFDVGYVTRYVADKSGWKGAIPFTVIIDSKGKVQFTHTGPMTENELESYVLKYSY